MKPLEDNGKSETVNFRVGQNLRRNMNIAREVRKISEAELIRNALYAYFLELRVTDPDVWEGVQERLINADLWGDEGR